MKPLNLIFGFHGRSTVERERERERVLDVFTVARFMLSGGIFLSILHLVPMPINVVKTKVQMNPTVHGTGIIGMFAKVLEGEGVNACPNGWEPTSIGFFLTEGVKFYLTEYFRRITCRLSRWPCHYWRSEHPPFFPLGNYR